MEIPYWDIGHTLFVAFLGVLAALLPVQLLYTEGSLTHNSHSRPDEEPEEPGALCPQLKI